MLGLGLLLLFGRRVLVGELWVGNLVRFVRMFMNDEIMLIFKLVDGLCEFV